jgi:hypothetical protein
MKDLLFNPFRRVAGGRSLVIGLLVLMLTAIVAYYSHCHFDGVIDVHVGLSTPLWSYFMEGLLDWLCAALIFFAAARICSGTKARFIDIAGTMAMARWPMFFAALLCFIPVQEPLPGAMIHVSAGLIVLSLGLLACSIWMVALMYQGYSISAHLRGRKAIWSFVIALVLSESISKLISAKLASVYTLNF